MIHPDGVSASETIEFASSIEIDRQVAANVDWLLRLKDSGLEKALRHFNNSNQTLSSLLAMNVVIAVLSLPVFILIGYRFTACRTRFQYFTLCICLAFLMIVNGYVWRVYVNQKAIIARHGGALPEKSKKYLQTVQMAVFTIVNILLCYRLIVKSITGECAGTLMRETWDCNPLAAAHALPSETSLMTMVMPILYSGTVRGANFRCTLFLWTLTVGSLLLSMIVAQALQSVLFLVVYVLSSLMIILEARRHNYFLFFTHLMLQETLRERERAADAANAAEMRSMIANVAHDLKTPLASFLSGIEFISHVAGDLLKGMDIVDCVHSISHCVTNMRNTNSFMLMTINRCIDYTKASKGLKLVPKYETIDLMDTLSLPLNCMKDIQNRITIVIEPISRMICSHIITDKQWLQENVLCLLSNAVKYSHDGLVTITVKKISSSSIAETSLYGTAPCSSRIQITSDELSIQAPIVVDRYSNAPPEDSRTAFLRIEVEDHGIGLSEDAMSNLFSPFKQAQRLAGGTGLGLFSMAKRIEALDGLCGVEHRRDGAEGCMFWFEIPYRADKQSSKLSTPVHSSLRRFCASGNNSGRMVGGGGAPSSPAHSLLAATALAASPQNKDSVTVTPNTTDESLMEIPELEVLIVDDSPAILRMTSMMLKRHKHQVSTACNGAEAVKMVSERVESTGRGFDVVLMDLQMPVMDGLEATKRLRAMESTGAWGSIKFNHSIKTAPSSARYMVSACTTMDEADTPPWRRTSLHVSVVRNVIIGVSANSDVDTANEAYRMGVDAFMSKPFALDSFYRTYDQILEQRGQGTRQSTPVLAPALVLPFASP